MPQNQRQFGNLLPLLAELKKCGLARVRVEDLSDPVQNSPVVLADAVAGADDALPSSMFSGTNSASKGTSRRAHSVATAIGSRIQSPSVAAAILPRSVHRATVVLLLLSDRIRRSRSLRLSRILVVRGMWVVLPVGLVVWRLVREDVLHGGRGTALRPTQTSLMRLAMICYVLCDSAIGLSVDVEIVSAA